MKIFAPRFNLKYIFICVCHVDISLTIQNLLGTWFSGSGRYFVFCIFSIWSSIRPLLTIVLTLKQSFSWLLHFSLPSFLPLYPYCLFSLLLLLMLFLVCISAFYQYLFVSKLFTFLSRNNIVELCTKNHLDPEIIATVLFLLKKNKKNNFIPKRWSINCIQFSNSVNHPKIYGFLLMSVKTQRKILVLEMT